MIPTLFRAWGFSFPLGSRNLSAPRNPCSVRRRVLGPPMVQVSAPSTGFVVSSMSLPYRHRPASSLRESLAPRPATCTFFSASSASISAMALSFATEISNPSSPVYPQRVTRQLGMPATVATVPVMNCILCRSREGIRRPATAAAPLPCSASSCWSSWYSMVTSILNSFRYLLKCAMSFTLQAPFTTMYMWSPAFVITVSSIIVPASFMIRLNLASPSFSEAMSPTTIFSRKATASLPCHLICPICPTSNTEAPVADRVCTCSFSTPRPSYCTGSE
mmetsp:Transcript_31207/g.68833  ORF Transcript_31207/g.68833 Transcript_31207/m.68833 type:complete len:276 (-) Transcript_31207:180-1007(-)